ncbi:MAG: AAA family ATPase [Chloroflexi bacterium]|nr:AAA family ATPase [Chloroflexota bacterium]
MDRTIVFGFRCNLSDDVHTLDVLGKLKAQLQARQAEMAEPFIALEDVKWVDVQIGFTGIEVEEQTHRIKVLPTLLRLEIPRAKGQAKDDSTLSILAYEKLDYWTALELGDDVQWNSDLFGQGGARWPQMRLVSRFEQDSNWHGFWPVFEGRELLRGRANSAAFDFILELYDAVALQVDAFLRSIEYLGPLRPAPERVYVLNGIEVAEAEKMGLKAFYDFVRGNVADENLLGKIESAFRELDLGDRVKANPPKEVKVYNGILSEVNVHETAEAGDGYNIADVGFGVSQILPILVTCFLAKKVEWSVGSNMVVQHPGTFIVIEQPELHLHPRAQANMAEAFLQTIYMPPKKDSHDPEREEKRSWTSDEIKRSGIRFLIETHSEHLLLRLRRALAETQMRNHLYEMGKRYLLNQEFSVYFAEREIATESSSLEKVEIGEYGAIREPPKEFARFFSDDGDELTAIVRAKLGVE